MMLSAERNAGIDWVRVAMTALVVLHHAAITYGGSGGWFWREEPNASNPLLIVFNAVNQSYFMGIFFLFAGYYTPPAFERKGAGRFLVDRIVRLGIPLAVFFFLLHPLTVAIARTYDGRPLVAGFLDSVREADFAPGPLWFAEALLVFTLAFVVFVRLRGAAPHAGPGALPSAGALALAIVGLGFVNFAVRLVYPVGRDFLWLQLGYLPCYVALFAAGCAASSARLLEAVRFRDAAPWLIVTAVGIVLLPFIIITRSGAGAFEGGWSVNALLYAMWDPLVACGMILGILWAAQRWWRGPTRIGSWLGGAAFGAYILHSPILVGLSVLAAGWQASPLVKFAIVGTSACTLSFFASGLLRTFPGVKRVI